MKSYIEASVKINAPAAKVWDYLTNPLLTKKYMFDCEAISDWKKGSPLLWKGVYEGKEIVYVKGTITEIQPGKLLVYTVIDPNNPEMEDKPENYLTVTYKLSDINGTTELYVSQGDYTKVTLGESRYKDTEGSWDGILNKIKELVETEMTSF